VLDGDVYAEPLVLDNRAYVATEGDSVAAIDLADGDVAWQTNLGTPVNRFAETCTAPDQVGITSTPVIDVARREIFVVAMVEPGKHELDALQIDSGAIVFRVDIDPDGTDPLVAGQRAALLLENGSVYVGFGGHNGDCGSYVGWVVAVSETGGAPVSYRVPAGHGGAVWGPSGPSLDPHGNLLIATGNSTAGAFSYGNPDFDFGNAVIRLTPDLQQRDWWAPSDWVARNANDDDVGSDGPTLVGGDMIIQATKNGVVYVLADVDLGSRIGSELFSQKVCAGAYGGTAHLAPYVYVACTDGLVALRMGPGPSFSVAWRSSKFWAGPPVIAGGAVWTVDTATGTLRGYGLADGRALHTTATGKVVHFTTPSVAGGLILVAADRSLVALRIR
jgi:hypothetical protein